MAGLSVGAPGMIPPLQLNLGSSATSGAHGGSTTGGGMGALNEGDWIIQTTGTGDNTAVPAPKPAAASNLILYGVMALGALWIFMRK